MDFTLIIPVYNEAERLRRYLPVLQKRLPELAPSHQYEILIVDDGSTDGTAAAVESLRTAPMNFIRNDRNRGKGHAIATGVQAAAGSLVLFTDVDLSVDLAALPAAIGRLGHADVVIGSRRIAGSVLEKRQPLPRELLGRGYVVLANLMFGIALSDFTCGFKGFRREAARQLFGRLQSERWSFDVEILVRARQLGLRIEEIPVSWRNDDDSRVRVAADIVRSFSELLAIRRAAGPRREAGAAPSPEISGDDRCRSSRAPGTP